VREKEEAMLNDHTIGHVAYQHRADLEGEAQAHRLVLEARGGRPRRVWCRELARELERLLGLVAAPSRRAGTSC
jgi:hypothetical protein